MYHSGESGRIQKPGKILVPTQENTGRSGAKQIKFSSDEEMVEYYREALLEAVVFCLTKGLNEEFISSLDIVGFGEVYKYLKRTAAREQLRSIGDMAMAFGGTKKQHKERTRLIESWLPVQESSSPANDSHAFKKKAKDW